MKDSEIYLRAAELCAEPDSCGYYQFACVAITLSGARAHEFQLLFSPNGDLGGTWFGSDYGRQGAHNSHYRVLAICFMAAIAESEGR